MKLLFSKEQLNRLSEFLANLSLIFIASLVAAVFTGGKLESDLILSAATLSLESLITSLMLI